jgi:hypothetical protein
VVCNVQTEKEFLVSTLQMFGLVDGYMEGEGHFPDWDKKGADDKLKQAKKRTIAKKIKEKKESIQMQKLRAIAKKKTEKEEKKKPEYFDLEPFQKAFRKFIAANGDARVLCIFF